jgi:hypothetical protein
MFDRAVCLPIRITRDPRIEFTGTKHNIPRYSSHRVCLTTASLAASLLADCGLMTRSKPPHVSRIQPRGPAYIWISPKA